MTVRKTFSLPDDLARALERASANQEKSESAVVREALEPYLASTRTSKLHLWVGKGVGSPRDPGTSYKDELVQLLDEEYEEQIRNWAKERGK